MAATEDTMPLRMSLSIHHAAPPHYVMKAPFFQAVKDGDAKSVKELLQRGAAVNARDQGGRTPLHEAAEHGQLEVANELLRRGADVNAQDKGGSTPLHWAADHGHLEVAEELLKHEADVNATNKGGSTPLHCAADEGHLEVAEELLKHEADVNATNKDGKTPLRMACEAGHNDVARELLERWVKALLDQGENVHATDVDGWTPLHYAAYSGHLEVAKELLLEEHGAEVNATDKDGKTPLHYAAYHGHLEVAKELLLEEQGAEVNATDKDGKTPLRMACEAGHNDVARELLERWVKALLDQGENVHATDVDGRTPLHYAAYRGHLEVAKELLLEEHGAEVNATDKDGGTPLHVAAYSGHLEVAKELLQRGADVKATNNDGWTPLHAAAYSGHLEVAKELLQHEADVKDGRTPLHYAAHNGHLELAKELLKHEADVNATDKYGKTPLHYAAHEGHLKVAKELLVKHGADVNAKDNGGRTPLHLAADNGRLELANELLKHKADVNAKDKNGKTPLDFDRLRDSWRKVAKMAHCSPKDVVQHTPELVKIIVDGAIGPPELDWAIVLLSRLEELVQDCPNPIETADASQAADAEDETERGKLMLLAEALLEVDMPSWPADRVRSLERELPRPPFEIGLEMLERLLGAKVARLGLHFKDQPEKLKDLGKPGVSRFIGQEEVIKLVKPLIKHRNDPVSAEGAPVCLLFNGPPGCGKTELAKKIAEAVFEEPIKELRDKRRFIKFDMGQFDDAVHANNFFGAPIGYEGGEGTLFKALSDCCALEQASEVGEGCPKAVVLLDELDKAHKTIRRDALLAAVDTDGQVQSNQGGMALRTERVIFIFTSNVIPSEYDPETKKLESMPEARARVFGKPLLSRTEVMQFESLARDDLLVQLVSNQLLRCKKNFRKDPKFKVPLLWTEQVPRMLVQAIKREAEQEHRQVDTRQLCRAELPKMLRKLLHDHEDYKTRASKGERPVAFVLKVKHETGAEKEKEEEAQQSLQTAQAAAESARKAHEEAVRAVIQKQKELQSLQGEVVPAHIWPSAPSTDQQAPAESVAPSPAQGGEEKHVEQSRDPVSTSPLDPLPAGSPAGPAPTAHSHPRAPAVKSDKAKAQPAATEIAKLQAILEWERTAAKAQLAAEVAKREQVAAEAANQKSVAEMERREQWAAEVARMKQEHEEAVKQLKAVLQGERTAAEAQLAAEAANHKSVAEMERRGRLAAASRAEAAEIKCVELQGKLKKVREQLQGKLKKVRERALRAKTVSWLVFAGSTAALVALLLYRYPWMVRLTMVLVPLAAALAAAVSLILLIAYLVALIAKKQDAFLLWLQALKDRIVAGIKECTLTAIERSIVACFKFFCCSCKGGALGFGIVTFCIISFFMAAWHAAIDTLFTLALLGTALAPVQVGIIDWLVEDSEPATARPPASTSDGEFDYRRLSDDENV